MVTEINGIRTGGIITETEAYSEIEKRLFILHLKIIIEQTDIKPGFKE